ncbi:MAG TPA: hypothetical protein VIB49_10370 [Thermoplasmata archaeon]|jgi:hypothetical protein
MSSVIEMLANKKRPAAMPPEVTLLPVLAKEHEGGCGEGCGCGDEAGGCCSS